MKAPIKIEQKKKHDLYVGLKQPQILRRNLLESSKSTILSLQNLEKIKEIEKEKEILKNKLKEDVKELKMLFLRLEKLIPEHAIENKSLDVKKETPVVKPVPKLPKKDKSEHEIDKLHNHLLMIEKRLSGIK